MIFLYIIAGMLVFLTLLYIFLIFPKKSKKTEEFFADQKSFAHRGLHGGGVPENSLAAFDLACKHGYGIEFDVHITADEKLVVFHDDTLERMCGIKEGVEEKTLAELQALTLAGTQEHIPSLEETLSIINGRAPLIIEIKGTKVKDTRVCKLTAKMLESYNGKWCMESFNPFYVKWWRKNVPSSVRGQLSCKMKNGKNFAQKAKDFLLTNMLLSFLARPNFIAYDVNGRKEPSFKVSRALGGYPVAWTIRSEEDKKNAEGKFKAIIFENIRP
ncbi:MAG: glycerophosphodiester phosphodiesterase [Ruminococcaceae bacterium]|nr:glycerophosphodiester phosphodiesterase [Oscillospiraceae bacterium]